MPPSEPAQRHPGSADDSPLTAALARALPRRAGALSVVELCAATATLSEAVRGSASGDVGAYRPVGPEIDPACLPFDDRSWDVVIGFDVLRRSSDPRAAAAEITRICRRRVILAEWNGINVRHWPRVLRDRPAPDRCRSPRWLLSLFGRGDYRWLGATPVPVSGASERWLAGIPMLRWQCQAVMIVGQRAPAWRLAA